MGGPAHVKCLARPNSVSSSLSLRAGCCQLRLSAAPKRSFIYCVRMLSSEHIYIYDHYTFLQRCFDVSSDAIVTLPVLSITCVYALYSSMWAYIFRRVCFRMGACYINVQFFAITCCKLFSTALNYTQPTQTWRLVEQENT